MEQVTSSQKGIHKNIYIYSSTSKELRPVYPHGTNECPRKVLLISEGLLWLVGGFWQWDRSSSGVLSCATTAESVVFYNVSPSL